MQPDALCAHIEAALADAAVVRRRRRRVLALCGVKQLRGPSGLVLQDALIEAGIYSRPPISRKGLSGDTWIRFSRVPYEVWEGDQGLLADHAAIVRHLGDWHEVIEPLCHLRLEAVEKRIPGSRLVPDFRFYDRRDGAMVVVEVKTGDGARQAVAQLGDYLRALESMAKAQNRGLYGILITGEWDEGVRERIDEQARLGRSISWYAYKTELNLHPLT